MADKQNFFSHSWLNFNDMLTPRLIEFFYAIGLVTLLLVSVMMLAGDEVGGGILVLIFGSILWRVWCELMIVIFKINENMQKIADRYKD